MYTAQKLRARLHQGAAVSGGLLISAAAFAEGAVDPSAAAIDKVSQAGVWGASIGGAVLGVLAAIAAFKWVRRAL